MSERNLDAELAAVEATLVGLAPAESSLARDRVMYLAGMAAGRAENSAGCSVSTGSELCAVPLVLTEHPTAGRLRLWRATTAAATLLACALGAALWLRPEPQVVIQRVEIPIETPRTADGLKNISTIGKSTEGFHYKWAQWVMRSYDPCISCATHMIVMHDHKIIEERYI